MRHPNLFLPQVLHNILTVLEDSCFLLHFAWPRLSDAGFSSLCQSSCLRPLGQYWHLWQLDCTGVWPALVLRLLPHLRWWLENLLHILRLSCLWLLGFWQCCLLDACQQILSIACRQCTQHSCCVRVPVLVLGRGGHVDVAPVQVPWDLQSHVRSLRPMMHLILVWLHRDQIQVALNP